MNTLQNYVVYSCFTIVILMSACSDSDSAGTTGGNLNITEAPPPESEKKTETSNEPKTNYSDETDDNGFSTSDYANERTGSQKTKSSPPKQNNGSITKTTITPPSSNTTNTADNYGITTANNYYPPTTTGTAGNNLNNVENPTTTLTTTTPTVTPKTVIPPKPEVVVLSSAEKNSLKKQLENEFENAQNKRFDNFGLKSQFSDPSAGGCITGSFIDNYELSYSLYTYFNRMRQEPYDIVVEDITLNDDGKIIQVRVREKAKLSGD